MVAQKTQKDPREYLPFFETLRGAADESERRYLIHNSLRHYYIAGYYLWYGVAWMQVCTCLGIGTARSCA